MEHSTAIVTTASRPRRVRENPTPLRDREMLSVREWAMLNGISVATAYRWIGKGDLALSKWRGRSFITREAADTWKARVVAA